MTIKKFAGNTEAEATAKAREELGAGAVVMNVKEIKPKGLFAFFKSSTYEVTAAIEEKEQFLKEIHNATAAAQNAGAMKQTGGIRLAADEKITVPPPDGADKKTTNEDNKKTEGETAPQDTLRSASPADFSAGGSDIEKRLENISNILEKRLSEEGLSRKADADGKGDAQDAENFKFMKLLYTVLLKNEVDEKYANQILDEAERLGHGGSVDMILSNVYQKMILKFGQPSCIQMDGKKPRVIFFIGPTGVGKTTTIAKIAAKSKVENDKKVAFLTADTYRIAAAEQLKIYANILEAPFSVIYSAEDLNGAIADLPDSDLIFVDTAGFSHKNGELKEDIKKLIAGLNPKYEKEVYLVLSATTKYKDLLEIADSYREISEYKIIFTKLDETSAYGNILNVKLYSGAELSYIADGQSVPDDLEVFDTQLIVKQLLGGKT